MKIISTLLLLLLCSFAIAQNTGVTDASSLTPYSLFHIHKNAASGQILQLTNTTSGNGSASTGLTLDLETNFNAAFKNNWNNSATGFTFWTNNGSLTEKLRLTNAGHLIPSTNNTYTLGSSTNLWNRIYSTAINIGTNDNITSDVAASYARTEMYGTAGSYIDFKDNSSDDYDARIIYSQNTGNFSIENKNAKAIYFRTTDVDRIIIDQYGHLFPAVSNTCQLGGTSNYWTAVYAVNGTIQTSDIRFKKNIQPLSYGLTEVLKLNPVKYQWKTDSLNQQKIGFIAQDVLNIIPEVVSIGDDANKTLGINYAEMNAVLVNAIKEQQKQIEALKKEIESIKKQLK